MRVLRIRLRNFRGVDDREVTFLRDGVTVVVGPNEVGKSSMAEALDLLFTALDSSAKAEVKAVKPVDRDAGPEVEADIETGPYAFTYRKRFLKAAETVLTMTRPAPEQLTGRPAHERVEQILAQTMDAALWRALRIKQGEAIGQASLAEAASLGQALDRAAGTVPEGQAETSLFDRARAEYELFWSPTGKPRGDWPLREAATQQQSLLDGIEAQLRAIAADVDRDASLSAERAALAESVGPARVRVAELQARQRQIEELERGVEQLEAAEREARTTAERAAEVRLARAQSAEGLAEAVANRDRQRTETEGVAPGLESARARTAAAGAALAEARAGREAAEACAKTARGDVEFLRAQAALAGFARQREALLDARASLADAEAAATVNLVDEASLDRIRAADRELRVAQALVAAGRPSVALTAHQDVSVTVAGASEGLRAGQTARWPVAEQLVVELPGVLRVEVAGGAGDAALARRADEAASALRAACAKVGVADLAAADVAAGERRAALARRDEQRRRIVELLGGDDPGLAEQLDLRIAQAECRVAGYLGARPPHTPVPGDEDEAVAAAARADAGAEAQRTAEAAAEREDRAARDQLAERDAAAREAAVRLEMIEADVASREQALAGARAGASDDELAAALAAAVAAQAAATAATAEARARLEREQPAAVKTLLDNARRVADDTAEQLRALEISLAEVRARLRDHGEDGLAERRDLAITARDAAVAELARWTQQAHARRRLYEALKSARDAAHLAYVGPLRDRIVSLGSVVFGPSLGVEVGEDLRIRSRTLEGRTVPYESLSVGAKEQLGVLMRLACAMLVADDGGVPLILDDTLGFSDPGRLETMSAVLGLAAPACQVIVLTSYPERYRHVGGARTVPLA